jgi:Ankyrin repeats (many copies)
MDKLNKYILSEILCIVGPWPEIIKLLGVSKKWKSLIESSFQYFTLQGVRHPKYIPCNVQIDKIIERFKSDWKLKTLDLRNVQISVELLAEVLLSQPNLIKLDLTNSQITLGQVWSCMQAKRLKEGYYLEELRITNNRTVYLGYDALVSVYPNLVQLYAGNTVTILDNLKIILSRLPKLQLLDLSLCSLDYFDMSYIDFRELLKDSDLKIFFISQINEKAMEVLLSCGVEIVETTIGDVLLGIKDEESLNSLQDWLNIGGDTNLLCHPNHELCSTLSAYPQMQIIKRLKDETLLRDVFKLLIRYNLDLSLHTPEGYGNLLNTAISEQHTGLAYLLIANGSDISPSLLLTDYEVPAMTLAADLGDMSIIQIFLDFGILNIDYYSPKFCNPVCTAAVKNNKELFLFLIEQGVQLFNCYIHPNILISSRETLEMALSPEYKSIFSFPVEMLYEAAQYYISKQKTEQVLLILENLDPNVKEQEANIIEQLLNNYRNSSVKLPPDMHKPLIILATEKKLMPVIYYLIAKGFDVNAEDMYGWTAFISASSYGYLELISYLCENGALVNKRDKWWRTALHQAAQNGHEDVVRELIRYGAALSPECDKGLTPLNYAMINRRHEIEEMLRSHGGKSRIMNKKLCSII